MEEKTQEILLGAGELYMYEFNGTEIPVHEIGRAHV